MPTSFSVLYSGLILYLLQNSKLCTAPTGLTCLSVLRRAFSLHVRVNGHQCHFVLSVRLQVSQHCVSRYPRYLSL